MTASKMDDGPARTTARPTTSRPGIPALLAAIMLAGLAWPPHLDAQQIASPFRFFEERRSVAFYVAWVSTNPGELELGPRSGIGLGTRASLRFGDSPLGLDAGLGFFPSTRLVWDLPEAEGQPPVQIGETDLNLAVADLALRFDVTGPRTWRNLLPYILFGGGIAAQLGESRLPGEEDEEEGLDPDVRYRFGTRFAGEIGGGVEWFASRQFTVRLDARNVLWQVAAPRAFLERQPQIPEREWTQNFWLSLGIAYRF